MYVEFKLNTIVLTVEVAELVFQDHTMCLINILVMIRKFYQST